MFKKPILILAALMLFLLPATDSPAAETGLGLGIQGGYGESKDADSGSPLAGVHVLINAAPWLGVVGMIDYKFDEDHSVDSQDYTVKSFPLSVKGRIYIPVASFSPYATAGVQYRLIQYGGDLFDNDSYDLDDSETAFGWLLGAGAEIDAGETMELFGEILYEAVDPDRDIDNAIQNAEDYKYDQWSVRGGLTFFLK